MKSNYELLRSGVAFNGMLLKLVNVFDIGVDMTYQRSLNMAAVDKMVKYFDEKFLGIIRVGYRDKRYYAIDGNHRLNAIRKRLQSGLSAPTEVLCLVMVNSTVAEEAAAYVGCNGAKPVTGNAKFSARLCFDGSPECQIQNSLTKYGFSLDFLPPGKPSESVKSGNGIRGANMLLKAWNNFGSEIFEQGILFFKYALMDHGCIAYQFRKGDHIFSICQFLVTQANKKSGAQLARIFRRNKMDFQRLIDKAYSNVSVGWARFKSLAKELVDAFSCVRLD